MALQMNVSGLRRNLKNIAHNYTDAQVKVREATSNDPWGPSSTIMSEIADLTYNVVAFTEIMSMIWKRLNDHGRNWRHVYKALVLLEYLIKTGSEKVSEQCKENIYAIQTLKDFQFLEENKDMGMNVREKAKTLVSLLKDDERLLNERVKALKAKERFAQSVSGIAGESDINSPSSPTFGETFLTMTASSHPERNSYGGAERSASPLEMENARPQTVGEEELQLQLALAMSKEEAEQEEAKKKSDDVRLQMALSQSEIEIRDRQLLKKKDKSKALNDLLDINFNGNSKPRSSTVPLSPPSSFSSSGVDPWGVPVLPTQTTPVIDKPDPWGMPTTTPSPRLASPAEDPWLPATTQLEEVAAAITAQEVNSDPWAPVKQKAPSADPWAPMSTSNEKLDPFAPLKPTSHSPNNIDEFEVLSSRDNFRNGSDPMNLTEIERSLGMGNGESKSKSPASFLGENSNLVNLDNLVSAKNQALKGGQVASVDSNDNALGSSVFDFPATAAPMDWMAPSTIAAATPIATNNPFMVAAAAATSSSLVAGANPFSGPVAPNPFQAQQVPKPTMNQMKTMTETVFVPTPEPAASAWNPVESSTNNFKDPFSL